MPDDPNIGDNRQPDNPEPNSDPSDVPASVTFMEMMRHNAARKAAVVEPTAADRLFSKVVDPATKNSSQAAMNAAHPAMTDVNLETPMVGQQHQHEAAMEQQRVRRVKRRKARRRQQTVGVLGGIVRSLIVVIIAAGLMATIFTWWTPSQFIAQGVKNELSIAQATGQVTNVPAAAPTIQATPNWLRKIGIVSGHRGPQVPPDPGAVCPDGLTEASINFSVAQKVVRNLRDQGYSVDLLDEFDPRLENYQAATLVSIHTNTCKDFGELVSGFLVAAAAARRSARGNDEVLVDCLAQYYAQSTGLGRREGLTVDMTDYHTFREIHALTPAAIIELGFLLADRDVLTNKQEEMAQGITNGIICFLEPGQLPILPTATPIGQTP